jgi:hypothetical protein
MARNAAAILAPSAASPESPARRAGYAAAHASRSVSARCAEKASGSSVVPIGRGRSLSENAPTIRANTIGMRAAR